MARDRMISPDFWTREAVIDCAPMTRLLLLGLGNFADDHGVQPLRPRTIRLQIFPGDDIDNERVRAMIDELVARGLVRTYEVEGQEYLAIVDWALHQRVGKRARRRYPPDPAIPVPADTAESVPPEAPAPVAAPPGTEPIDEPERWPGMIKKLLHQYWPRHAQIETLDDEAVDGWTAKWIAEGCDFTHDILPAVRDFHATDPFRGPPAGLQQLDESVTRNRTRRAAQERVPAAA